MRENAKEFCANVNFAKYSQEIYDENIVASIPGYKKLHEEFTKEITLTSAKNLLELGTGTGNTTIAALLALPKANATTIEILSNMTQTARAKLNKLFTERVTVIQADYLEYVESKAGEQPGSIDAIFSLISVHHLNHEEKQLLFQNVYKLLAPGGTFILGDLMDFDDPRKTLQVNKQAMRELLTNATTKEIAAEWLSHWLNLNKCATVEQQKQWLEETGFTGIRHCFEALNTNMLVAQKK